MNDDLKVGQLVSGFEVTEIRPLDELKALGVRARHVATGAEVFHLLNDDEENLFAFAFATPSEDSTGVAHILEHSVLCGSERHPLKDAFLVLAQGSLQTFLNAMTYPDKTVYPASSTNERDYFNLMSVYGDAVFRPLLAEWTFLQEGRRYEFAGEKLSLTGVVYNEMKGAYSSMDSIAGDWAFRSVLSGTPYEYDSGGDPDDIPSLEWEGLVAFHKSRYAPANCRIFLCGNIPTAKQLDFLNDRFLSSLSAGVPVPPIQRAERWTEPRSFRVPYPASNDGKSTVLLSWLLSDSTDGDESIALAALTEALLGHDGSPLSRVLVDSHLGEDLAPASGLEGELRETVFTVGLRGVDANDADKVETLVLDTLRRLADEGIPAGEVEAALLSLEFSNREIRRSGGPFSLSWLRRSLRGWLHGAEPWETLLFVPPFNELKARLAADPRYLEGLIRRYLLDNPHRALVVVEPEKGLTERMEADLADTLERKTAALTAAAAEEIRSKSAELERVQAAPDSEEALATIPHISRADLSKEVEIIPRQLHDAGGIPVVSHELFTNGITYIDLALPVDVLSSEDYPYLPLLARSAVASGLPGMDYGEVSSLLARTVGGFHAVLQTSSPASGAASSVATPAGIFDLVGRDWLIFRVKALDEKIGDALDLARRLIAEADFSDHRRLNDLVLELRNDLDSSLAPGGHSYASSRAGRRFSRARAVDEIWGGTSQIALAHELAEADVETTAARLISIREKLLASGGLIANLTGSSEAIASALDNVRTRFLSFGSPRPRNPASVGAEPFTRLVDGDRAGAEVFSSSSLQIGFASLALNAAPFATPEQAAELVLAHRLSTGALWEDIRMKGGAYGAFAYPDGLEPLFSLATYRDPDPARSLDSFRTALKGAAEERVGGDELEKAIIGTYAKETRPRTSADKGMADFMRLLCAIEDGARRRKLQAIVDLTADELAAAAARLSSNLDSGVSAVIAGNGAASKAAAQLGVEVKELPV